MRLEQVLAEAGFLVDHAEDGDAGWYLGSITRYDGVVLDLGLPKLPGLVVLRRWRAADNHVPVLILSARGTWTERVNGLNAGADDYLEKPFAPDEVIARLRALIRRASQTGRATLACRGLVLDTVARTVWLDGDRLDLTAIELKILCYLMTRQGRIVSQDELLDHVYALHHARQGNTIEVHIARLRKKVGHEAIRTVRGLGYRMG